MSVRDIHELAEYTARALRERAGILDGSGRFFVDRCCTDATYESCTCYGGMRLAMCDRCTERPADHDCDGELLCTTCRDEAGVVVAGPEHEPTVIIPREPMADLMERRPAKPSSGELDAELLLYAEAGQR